uniref:Protein kinase domain-containing protein n=1 Tax=Panagrolaimus davidi TaxID=227884 RepID=A0A914PHV3_9BILA
MDYNVETNEVDCDPGLGQEKLQDIRQAAMGNTKAAQKSIAYAKAKGWGLVQVGKCRWAFGIVLFEMYSFGEAPFAEIENSQILKHLEDGNRLEKPELCPNEIYEIMLKCWNSNPTFRPFFDELITFFTVFLEHSTQNYGYLDLKKSETNDPNKIEKIICSL